MRVNELIGAEVCVLYQMSHKAYFSGESYLGSTAKISPFDAFEGGLNFRTLQPSGLLFYHSDGVNASVSLGDLIRNDAAADLNDHHLVSVLSA